MCWAISRLLSRWKESRARPTIAIGPQARSTGGASEPTSEDASGAASEGAPGAVCEGLPVNGSAPAGVRSPSPQTRSRASMQRVAVLNMLS